MALPSVNISNKRVCTPATTRAAWPRPYPETLASFTTSGRRVPLSTPQRCESGELQRAERPAVGWTRSTSVLLATAESSVLRIVAWNIGEAGASQVAPIPQHHPAARAADQCGLEPAGLVSREAGVGHAAVRGRSQRKPQ